MRYLKKYNENFEWDEDDFDFEEEYLIEDKIKHILINNPTIHNVEHIQEMIDLRKKDTNEYYRVYNLFNSLTDYSKLYNNIDYDKIKKDSIVKCNIINIDSSVKKRILSSPFIKTYHNADRCMVHETYSITPYNIKEVIRY